MRMSCEKDSSVGLDSDDLYEMRYWHPEMTKSMAARIAKASSCMTTRCTNSASSSECEKLDKELKKLPRGFRPFVGRSCL